MWIFPLLVAACVADPIEPVDSAGGIDSDGTDETGLPADTDAAPTSFCPPSGTTFRACSPGIDIERWWSDLVPDPLTAYSATRQVPWEPYMVAVRDFDGDGDDDVLLGGQPGAVVMWLREGERFVPTPVEGPVRPGLGALVADDFDGDGKAEAIVAALRMNEADVRTLIEQNLGGDHEAGFVPFDFFYVRQADDGRFVIENAAKYGLGPTAGVETMFLGDLTGDGRNELLVTSIDERVTALAYRQLPGGGWQAAPELAPAGVASNSMLTVHDATGDGRPELFVGDFASLGRDSAAVWVEDAEGGWVKHRTGPFSGDEGARLMGGSFLDADLDGNSDLYVTDIGRQHLLLLDPGAIDGVEVTQAAGLNAIRTLGSEDYPVAWGARGIDLDGDRDPDIASPCGFEHLSEAWDQQLLLYWHQGVDERGLPRFERDLTPDVVASTQERGLIAADFNGDGWPDLLPLPTGGKRMRLLVNPGFPGRTLRFVELRYPTGQGAEGAQLIAHYADGAQVAHVATGSSGFSGIGRVGVWLAMDGLDHVTARAMSDLRPDRIDADELGDLLIVEP